MSSSVNKPRMRKITFFKDKIPYKFSIIDSKKFINLLHLLDAQNNISIDITQIKTSSGKRLKPEDEKKSISEIHNVHGLNYYIVPEDEYTKTFNIKMLEKFQNILRLTQDQISMDQLKSLLDFSSIKSLQDWLIGLKMTNFEIDWENNQIIVNSQLSTEIDLLLQSYDEIKGKKI